LIHFIGASFKGKNLPVFAQIVKRNHLLSGERTLELFQLNYFHECPFLGLGGKTQL